MIEARGAQGDVDFAVVGAGFSGVAAARALRAAGATVRVLEARDRVGGRTLTRRVGGGVFDLGGQWMGPGQPRLAALAREVSAATFPTFCEGKKVLDHGGRTTEYRSAIPAVSLPDLLQLQVALSLTERRRVLVPPGDPLSVADAAALDATSLETWKRRWVKTPAVRGLLDAAVRVIFGAEPSEISLLYFLAYLNGGGGLLGLSEIRGGAQQDRFVDGVQTLCERAAEALGDDLVLGAPVRRIEQDPDGVTVAHDGGRVRARRVIVALAPALAGRIEYEPRLPARRDQLTQRYPMGATVKLLVTYPTAFWRDEGYSGEVVCTGGPVSVVFDNCAPEGAQPALVAFVVGEQARRWSERAPDRRRAALLGDLSRWLGPRAAEPLELVEQDWSAEAWTRGCPVGVPGPGALTAAGAALREPVGRIHWAGTETASVWAGYLEGALEAGERAAAEVLERP